MARQSVVLKVNADKAPASFAEIRLVHARVDKVEKMTFDEFQKRTAQLFKNNANPAMRYFNHSDDDYKFCVLTLANRDIPGTFNQSEIGKSFEYFDEQRRKLIIDAMNKIARWGDILPRNFSSRDRFLSE